MIGSASLSKGGSDHNAERESGGASQFRDFAGESKTITRIVSRLVGSPRGDLSRCQVERSTPDAVMSSMGVVVDVGNYKFLHRTRFKVCTRPNASSPPGDTDDDREFRFCFTEVTFIGDHSSRRRTAARV